MLRLFFVLGLFALAACAPAPTALPEDFNADFEF
jgi:hypothetical protein